jgi:hypothetical protein
MDESNDITDTAQLLIFIRGIYATITVRKKTVWFVQFENTTTGEDLFLKAQETLTSLELSWGKLKSVTTDGGESICGSKTGVVGRICKEGMQVGSETLVVFHCINQQKALCCQILSLKDVMGIVISTVNYIRRNGLTHRQFQYFLKETEEQYGDVYYSAVRWLSRGAVLMRFFHLRSEIDIFMTERGKTGARLSDDKCILELAFLVDITTSLNELNMKLQGKGKLLSDRFSDIKAF